MHSYHTHHNQLSHHAPRQSSTVSIATVHSQFATITRIIFSLALRMLLADWLCAWRCRLPGGVHLARIKYLQH
jgi:hypothetical protein